jgi:predicted nucleic acid-binding protein
VIVVDASVLTPALVDDEDLGDRMRARLADERLTAPALVDIEVLSALRGIVRGGKAPAARAQRAIRDLAALPLGRAQHPRLAQRIWELRDRLSAYDAAYVALAERVDTLLLTLDLAFAAVPGIHCEVELLRRE